MNDIYIQNKGMTKTLIHENGHNKISKIGWDSDYDGNIANVDLDVNNNGHNSQLHFELDNHDLEELLNIQPVQQSLHTRLATDFKKKKPPLYIIVDEPKTKIKVVEPLLPTKTDMKYTHVSSPLPMEDVVLPLAIKKGRRNRVTFKKYSHHKKPSSRSYYLYKRTPSSSSSRRRKISYRRRTSSHR